MATVRAGILALVVGLVPAPTWGEPQQPPATRSSPQQPQPPEPQHQSPGATPAAKSSAERSGFDDRIIERIRRQLELAPGVPILGWKPRADVPLYRVDVFGYRFRAPEWRFQVALPPSAVPQPLGGADYYEMMRLITPPEFWGSASMSNRDVLHQLIVAGETWAGRLAVKKAVKSYHTGTINRTRGNVQRELGELAAHNARSAGQGGESAAKPSADKKKQPEKKPVEVKKK